MEYDDLSPDYTKTFSRYTNLLKLIGIDFFSSSGISVKRLCVFNTLFLPFVCGQFSLLAKIGADNFLESTQCVPVCVMSIFGIIKMTIALIKKLEMKQMLLQVGELWPSGLQDGDEKTLIMKAWMRRLGSLPNATFIYIAVSLGLFEIMPLLGTIYNFHSGVDEYLLPIQPIDFWPVNSTTSYLAAYAWNLAGTVPSQIFLYVPYDILIIAMTSNVSVLFRLLQVDLVNSVEARRSGRREDIRPSDAKSYERIVEIVKTHQILLKIAEQLSNIFGLVIFTHVAFSAVIICFFGFMAVVVDGVVETLTNLVTVLFAVITIFLLALSGQILCDTSSGVGDAAYQSLWYENDKKVKKLVLFIIIRSQKTCYLSALGFSSMTLRSFSKIMSTAWTYFSLLVQMYQQE